jgi:hypothetical protein
MGCGGTKMYETASAANVILTEQQAIKRTARLERLPVHLRLGVTLAGMRELLSQLPSDALEQVNANIPLEPIFRSRRRASPSTPRTRLSTATSSKS